MVRFSRIRRGSREASTASTVGSKREVEPSCRRVGVVIELAYDEVDVDEDVDGRIVRNDATELLLRGSASAPNAIRSSGRATSSGVNLKTCQLHSISHLSIGVQYAPPRVLHLPNGVSSITCEERIQNLQALAVLRRYVNARLAVLVGSRQRRAKFSNEVVNENMDPCCL